MGDQEALVITGYKRLGGRSGSEIILIREVINRIQIIKVRFWIIEVRIKVRIETKKTESGSGSERSPNRKIWGSESKPEKSGSVNISEKKLSHLLLIRSATQGEGYISG